MSVVSYQLKTGVGNLSQSSPGAATESLNAAATWFGYSYIPQQNKTISKVLFYCTGVTGSLGSSDLQCHIFNDSGTGDPGTSQSSTATVTTTPTGALWVEFTGLSQAVTAGTQYWIVLKNVNGTPASNYPTWNLLYAVTGGLSAGTIWNITRKVSIDSGSTWTGATARGDYAGYRIEHSDGSFYGLPVSSAAGEVTNVVYSAREVGAKFTSPSGIMNVWGVQMSIGKGGSPTGSPLCKIYTGASSSPTLLATGTQIPNALVGTYAFHYFPFSAVVQIPANTVVRVVTAESSQSDASGNNYRGQYVYTVENSATSKALMPWGGCVQTYSTDGGANFTETDTKCPVFSFVLDATSPFL